MNRLDTINALQQIHDLVVEKSRRRVNSAKGMLFSIHKTDKKLDRMGMGQRHLFHVIPFTEILNFVKWELLQNHLFVVSDHVLSQKRGVAIGEALSGPIVIFILYDTRTPVLQRTSAYTLTKRKMQPRMSYHE